MKFINKYFNQIYFYFNTTAIYLAVNKGSVEIVKLLLAYDKIDVNYINILHLYIFMKFS